MYRGGRSTAARLALIACVCATSGPDLVNAQNPTVCVSTGSVNYDGPNIDEQYTADGGACCLLCSKKANCKRWVYDSTLALFPCQMKEDEGSQVMGGEVVQTAKKMIPIPPHHGGGVNGSWGQTFIIALSAAIIVYLVIGCVFNMVVSKEKGLDMLPNRLFWQELPSLVRDGAIYTYLRCRRCFARNQGYEDVSVRQAAQGTPEHDSKHKKRDKRSKREKKSKKPEKKKEKKAKKAKKKKKDKHVSASDDMEEEEVEDEVAEFKPTRSVHLSSGARETGVKMDGGNVGEHYYDESGTKVFRDRPSV